MNKKNTKRGFRSRLEFVMAAGAFLASLIATQAADTAYSQAVKSDNPLVYYRFEESADATVAEDSSGLNRIGTYSEVGLQVPSFNSVLGNAGEFDGDLSNLAVPALQPAGEFTLEVWIKPNIYSTWGAIYTSDAYPDGAVHFQVIDDNKVEFAMNGNGPEDVNFGDNSVFAEGLWTYVAIAFSTNTSSMTVYVNGAPFNTNVYTTAVAASFEAGHIGAWNGSERQFDGLIDEFAIYPAVLTPARIQAHYQAAVGSYISIVAHPRDAAAFVGGTATFSASATVVGSAESPRYQWQRDGVDIPGATSATYTTPPLTLDDDEARYRAIVSVPGGSASSTTREASVSVTDLPATGYANAVKADKPVVYYRFEESSGATTAEDSSTGNHPGTYNNVLLQNASFNAVLGNAGGFDGSSGRLAVPALGSAGQFTIEAWIKPEIYKTSQAVYTADDIVPGASTLELVDEGGMLLSVEGNSPTDMDFGDDALFPAAQWRYVVLTYDSGTSSLKAYVNGELIEEMTYEIASPADFAAGHLGAGSDVNSFYRGLIDEFAIYTNVLSQERILAHYATATGAIVTPQPQDVAIFSGNTATFTAGLITGFDEPLRFQWQRNGADIPGATSASYSTSVLADADSGSRYRAVITVGATTYTTREASVSVTSLPPNGYRDAVTADAPLVYYRFEDAAGSSEATDSSSFGQNGEYNDVLLEQASFNAVLGRAARFDESSVSVPPLGSLTTLTIEAWIKPDIFEEFNAIFTTEEWMPGSLHLQLVDDEMIALSLNAGPDAEGEDQEEDAVYGGSSFFAPGEWRHVAVTYNSADSVSVLYVNGVPAGTNVFSIPPVTADLLGFSHVGAWNGDERFFFGSMDEFAIYDKVLAPGRILAHYQAAAGTAEARPSIVITRSGNELTLTWTGSGFILQQNGDLGTSNWQAVAGAGANSATVPIANGNNFFRLRKP